MGGGGGEEDNSGSIMQQQNMAVVQAIQAVQAEQARKEQQAKNEADQAAWMESYNQQQAQWEGTLNEQRDAMRSMQDSAAQAAEDMKKAMAEEAARAAALEAQRIADEEQANKLTTMKEGMITDSTSELEAQNALKKRRTAAQPLKTLLTGGLGVTGAAPTQVKTLLGQ